MCPPQLFVVQPKTNWNTQHLGARKRACAHSSKLTTQVWLRLVVAHIGPFSLKVARSTLLIGSVAIVAVDDGESWVSNDRRTDTNARMQTLIHFRRIRCAHSFVFIAFPISKY